MNPDFSIPYGDNPVINIQYLVDGTPTTISGLTINMAAKGDFNSNTPLIFNHAAVPVNVSAGVAKVNLLTSDTAFEPGSYYYDMKVTDVGGDVWHRQSGVFEITPVVTP